MDATLPVKPPIRFRHYTVLSWVGVAVCAALVLSLLAISIEDNLHLLASITSQGNLITVLFAFGAWYNANMRDQARADMRQQWEGMIATGEKRVSPQVESAVKSSTKRKVLQ